MIEILITNETKMINPLSRVASNLLSMMESLFLFLLIIMFIMAVSKILYLLLFPNRRAIRRTVTKPKPIPKIEKKSQEIIFEPPEKVSFTSFFCQLDNALYSKEKNRYQCDRCLRFICEECYSDAKKVGFNLCPNCKGKLIHQTKGTQIAKKSKG